MLALDVSTAIAQGSPTEFAHLFAQTISNCPGGIIAFYDHEHHIFEKLATDDDEDVEHEANTQIRNKLDAGLGDELFDKYRGLERPKKTAAELNADPMAFLADLGQDSLYRVVILAAFAMRYDARIRDQDVQQ